MPESLDMTIKMGVKFHSISPDRSELDSHSLGCGRRIWTTDLRVMSPTSYQTAPSRDISVLF